MKRDSTPTERRRDPENTRNALLDAAFSEMHLNGFRAASLDKIFAEAGITRGALYHHLPGARERFISPFLNSKDIFGAFSNICARVSGELNHDEALLRGCPMINLAQEMSGIDDGFRLRLAAIHEEWRDAVAVCIRRSQAEGTVRQDIEPREVGTFIVAAFQGAIGFAKNARDREPFELCRKGLESYVTSLSPDPKQRAA